MLAIGMLEDRDSYNLREEIAFILKVRKKLFLK